MSDEEQKSIFSKNLNYYLTRENKTQKEVADVIGVIPSTFNTWCQGIALPRMGKVQALADYFHITKTDLIDEKSIKAEPEPIHTIAAHFDGDEYSEEELEEIRQFAEFVKNRKK